MTTEEILVMDGNFKSKRIDEGRSRCDQTIEVSIYASVEYAAHLNIHVDGWKDRDSMVLMRENEANSCEAWGSRYKARWRSWLMAWLRTVLNKTLNCSHGFVCCPCTCTMTRLRKAAQQTVRVRAVWRWREKAIDRQKIGEVAKVFL